MIPRYQVPRYEPYQGQPFCGIPVLVTDTIVTEYRYLRSGGVPVQLHVQLVADVLLLLL